MTVQYYADSDVNGNIVGFYNDDVWDVTKIPTTVIEITEEQWQDCLSNQGKWLIKSGALALAPAPTAAQLLAIAQAAKKAQLWDMYNQTLAAGFVSSASGTSTTYGFSTTNQDEMTQVQGAISAGIETFPIDYGDNLGNIIPLTQAQFTVLESDANRFKWAQVKQLRALIGQVMAATTVDAANAIQWVAATY